MVQEMIAVLQENADYQQLKHWVEAQELDIYYIFSLPRSLSTAIQIAITEGADGQINEPFFREDYNTISYDAPTQESNFYNGCKRIVEQVAKLRQSKPEGMIKLVLNDIAGDLTESEFRALLPLSKNFAITVRDPHLQMRSYMVRVGNDHFQLCDTKLDDIAALTQCQKPEAAAAVKWGVNKNQNSWRNVAYYTSILTELAEREAISLAIIEGYMLQAEPVTFMQTLCDRWGMQYSEDMVNNWQVGDKFCSPVSAGLPRELEVVNGWHGRARNSKGFEPFKEQVVDSTFVDVIPADFQAYIAEAKLLYAKIMSNSYAIRPSNSTAIAKIQQFNPLAANVIENWASKPEQDDLFHESREYCPRLRGRGEPPALDSGVHQSIDIKQKLSPSP